MKYTHKANYKFTIGEKIYILWNLKQPIMVEIQGIDKNNNAYALYDKVQNLAIYLSSSLLDSCFYAYVLKE